MDIEGPLPSGGTEVFDLEADAPPSERGSHRRVIAAGGLGGAAVLALGLVLFPWLGIAPQGTTHNQLVVSSALVVLGASFVVIAAAGALGDTPVELRVGPQGVGLRYRRGPAKEIGWDSSGLRGSISHMVLTSPERASDPPKGWLLYVRDRRTKIDVGTSFTAGNAVETWVRRLRIPSASATLPWTGRGRDTSVLELFEFSREGRLGIATLPAAKGTSFPREPGRPPVNDG